MPHSFSGWAPPDRIRRSVVLPLPLDQRISTYAREHDSTPSTVLAETVQQAVENEGPVSGVNPPVVSKADDYVERAVLLDSSVTEALDECVYTLRIGRNGSSPDIGFSDLVAALVDRYLHTNGNGTEHKPEAT